MDQNTNADGLVTLSIKDQDLKCDKQVLCEHSDYFKAMFGGGFAESDKNTVHLQGVNLKAMKIILGVVVDGKGSLTDEDLLVVFSNAHMLQFKNVTELCVERLLQIIDEENCLQVWLTAERLHVEGLAQRAKNFALKYFPTFKDSDVLFDFDAGLLVDYLSDDCLRCENEMDVFYACMGWLSGNDCHDEKEVSHDLLLKFLSCIRYRQLDVSNLEEIRSHPLIKESVECCRILARLVDLKRNLTSANGSEIANKISILNTSGKRTKPQNLCFGFVQYVAKNDLMCNYEEIDAHFYKYDIKTDECENDNFLERLENVGTFDFSYCKGIFSDDDFLYLLPGRTDQIWIFDRTVERLERKALPFDVREMYPMQPLFHDGKIYVLAKEHVKYFQQGYILFVYDCRQGEWKSEIKPPIQIPDGCRLSQCIYKNQFLILFQSGQLAKAYFFNENESTWSCGIEAGGKALNKLIKAGEYKLISHEDSLYLLLKNECMEIKIADGTLREVSKWSLGVTNYRHRKIISHGGIAYVVYCIRQNNALYNVVLEKMCLKTHATARIFSKAFGGNFRHASFHIFRIKGDL